MHGSYVPRESETDDLAAARGLINGTAISVLIWGFILGFVVGVFG